LQGGAGVAEERSGIGDGDQAATRAEVDQDGLLDRLLGLASLAPRGEDFRRSQAQL
jgi:hypothetical protein